MRVVGGEGARRLASVRHVEDVDHLAASCSWINCSPRILWDIYSGRWGKKDLTLAISLLSLPARLSFSSSWRSSSSLSRSSACSLVHPLAMKRAEASKTSKMAKSPKVLGGWEASTF